MPDNIERTIFQLELDGSAYIAGADKLSNSTNKLAQAQEKANQKLVELNRLQDDYKKSLSEIDGVLKANELETVSLTKRLNELKEAEKGTSVEAKNLQAQLRAIALNTKEFKIESASLKTGLADTTAQIKIQSKEVLAAESAHTNWSKGISRAYGGLRQLAYLIPGLGIAGLISLISGPLIDAFKDWIAAGNKLNDTQKKFLEINKEAAKGAAAQVSSLTEIKIKLNDLSLPESERVRVAKEYNKTAEETNKIDIAQIGNITLINEQISKQNELIIQRAISVAALSKLNVASDAFVEKELNLRTALRDAGLSEADAIKAVTESQKEAERIDKSRFNTLDNGLSKTRDIINPLIKETKEAGVAVSETVKQALLARDNAKFNLEREGDLLSSLISVDGLTTKTKTSAGNLIKGIFNIYEQELQKLRSDLAKLDEKGFTSEETITKAIEEDFKKRSLAFEKAFQNKQLTQGQLESLNAYLKNLQDLTLSTQLKNFRDQRATYLKSIEDELSSIQAEESAKRISLIGDIFERERQTILSESDKTALAIQQRRDKQIADIIKRSAANGFSKEEVQPLIDNIEKTYSKLLDDLDLIKNKKLQKLSFDTFERLDSIAKEIFARQESNVSVIASIEIRKQVDLLQSGKINYLQYQEAITKIAKDASNERFNNEVQKLDALILRRQNELFSGTVSGKLTGDQQEQLRKEIDSLNKQLSDLQKANATGNVDDPTKKRKGKTDSITDYAEAIGQVADSVIQFWQVANDAESKALDRSIALQEKRVTAAQRIADRGNAEYLKAEEDRLTELNVKRENAARRQLGIDAALQASQILVGITGAIAKIADGPTGPAETIAAIAVIFGALATGYGLVKSLQGNQPKFAKGDKFVKRNGAPSGTDTIPAWLNEGEAVIPTDKNKAYHPAIAAIYDGTIPADKINNFVKNYHQIKTAPYPNYDRIKESAELHIGMDGKMAILLQENNDLQRQTLRAMKSMSVSANIDRDGVAIMVNEYASKMKIDRRV